MITRCCPDNTQCRTITLLFSFFFFFLLASSRPKIPLQADAGLHDDDRDSVPVSVLVQQNLAVLLERETARDVRQVLVAESPVHQQSVQLRHHGIRARLVENRHASAKVRVRLSRRNSCGKFQVGRELPRRFSIRYLAICLTRFSLSDFFPFLQCLSWSWYLSNDMQFFVIGLIVMNLSTV